MNFLGHLYLSKDQYDLMLANLFGDFVKGRDYTHLPQIVQQGVTLHREIDNFIDRHPLVLEILNDFLYKDLPKVANIAIDLYMDHLLAKNWKQFHRLDLKEFEALFFDYALNPSNQTFENNDSAYSYPKDFISLLHIMHEKSWLSHYEKLDGLKMASSGLSRRISFNNNLYDAVRVFQKNQNQIEIVFFEFIEDAQNKFLN